MRRVLLHAAVVAVFAVALVSTLQAQGSSTSTLSGTVLDQQAGALPGVTVVARNVRTGARSTAVTNSQGTFSIPALAVGTYTVTLSLEGFKTSVLENITLNAGVPATVRTTLQLGGLQETVVVSGADSVVQTQSSAVATTLNVTQISNLPLTSRSVLDFVVNLPGVNTPGGSRNSTINGLPQSAINITLDGVNVQDNTLKTTDGFFAIVNPRLDAIDEVTVSAAAQTADAAGQGAVQIRFVTRSGSNTFSGSGYHYYRNDRFNENTWFNERDNVAKPELLQNQPGFRAGGPVFIPGMFDGHNRLFFFFNYEEFRQPSTLTRNRTILSPSAQAGLFRYNTSAGVREVDLFSLAGANGQTSSVDPTVRELLSDIRAATGLTGAISNLPDPNLQRYTFNVDRRSLNRYPTVRMDWNLSDRHRVSGSLNYQRFLSIPDTLNGRDPVFPGFPVTATQTSQRIGFSSSLRSTFTRTMVNELRIGGSGAPVQFFKELQPDLWNGDVANQAGFALNIAAAGISNPSSGATPQSRNASTFLAENTLNWLAGTHSVNIGGSFNQVDVWLRNQRLVPTLDFDVVTGDPAEGLFTSRNFPGSSSTNRNDAADLYAVLTGRVGSMTGDARLDEATNQFVFLGPSMQRGRLRDTAFWLQDQWRPRTDLTLNLGMRYELQLPFYPRNDSYSKATLADAWGISGLAAGCSDASRVTPDSCNIFKPGATGGKLPDYQQFGKGEHAYNIDWDNLAPSVGFAWTPAVDGGGFLGRLLGNPGDTVFRGGFARAFNRPGMSDFTGRFDDNPGIIITANRTLGDGNLVMDNGGLPVLLRQASRLGAPAFDSTRTYPMTDVQTGDVAVFDPSIQVPYADSWTLGYQRALGRDFGMEIRYVGTRSRDLWRTYNYNELNILENGFLDEFELAQANLQANIAAGRGSNFRYFGPGTGTSPLPIFLAYFNGSSDAANPARYTSSNFASSTFVNPLALRNPQPFAAANALDGASSRRANAISAGLPRNFLVANPDRLGGAEVTGNGDFSNYNSLQVELRRRMRHGFQMQASYVLGRALLSDFYSFRRPFLQSLDVGTEGGVTHAFKANWVYELPFGRGRRFGGDAGPVLERLIGGWQFHGTARVQSGVLVDFGNVRLVGITKADLKAMYKLRIDENRRVWMLPQDVIDNTVKAFSVSATSPTGYSALGAPEGRHFAPANGPDCIEIAQSNANDPGTGFGDCGARAVEVAGPLFKNVDLSIAKLVPIAGRVRAEFRVELLNAFNWVNFLPVTGVGADPNDYEVTGLNGITTSRVMQLVTRISW